jgi:hypothetical protein
MADVLAKIDNAKNQPMGAAYVYAGPKVQEGDTNRVLETAQHEGPLVADVESKYTARFA